MPQPDQAHQHRQVALERRRAEVLVHLVEAVEQRAEIRRGRSRASWTGRSPSPSSSGRRPSPRSRTCWRCRCRTRGPWPRSSTRRRSAGRPPSRRRRRPLEQPGARRVRVGHRLLRREGLRRDDEQRRRRVEVAHGFGEIGAVDVRHEAERELARAVVPQGFVRHHRPEVGAADADVDDVGDPLAVVPGPLAVAHPVRERAHAVEHRVHAGHDVLAVDDDRRVARGAQRDVQRGAVLRHVDPVAGEHRGDGGVEAGARARAHRAAPASRSVIRFFE